MYHYQNGGGAYTTIRVEDGGAYTIIRVRD